MRDPVCGMTLKPEQIKAKTSYLNCTYSFCSLECQKIFEANPRAYLSESATGS
jgi:P-type Cu+ transporter